jgi:murein DD-endopeptidase MepM/ murein hydrolase activator NlpD
MSKAFVFVLFVFVVLVIGNVFLNAAGSLLSHSFAAVSMMGPLGLSGSSGATSIDANLFAKGGAGMSYVTQGYGRTPYAYLYPGDWHDGIDIAATYGAPIYSPNDGVVIAVGNQDNYCYQKAFGKYVAVRDSLHGLILWYAHLGTQAVSVGQTITKGMKLGTVGTTGFETGTHLHFSIFKASGFAMISRNGCGPEPTGQDVNPLNYLGSVYN